VKTDLWNRFLNLLFPEPTGCLLCAEDSGEDFLCPTCRSLLHRNGPVQCSFCGRTVSEGGLCSTCRHYPLSELCRGMEIFYQYDGSARQAIRLAKFESRRSAAKAMAILFARQIERMPNPPDAIVYVPSHPLRILMRGYASMAFTARELSRLTGIPVEPHALRRVRYSEPMYTADRHDRHARVAGAFVRGKLSQPRRHLLLIDDVCTSGATIFECLTALNSPDAVTVFVFAGHGDSALDGSFQL